MRYDAHRICPCSTALRVDSPRPAKGQLSVAELSAQFGVSADTIRRDLDLLSVGGFVRRTHGGAVPRDYLVQGGPSAAQRTGSRRAEQRRIAQCASVLLAD